ncbi:MAG: CYTH domain-containing protein [Thermodesulfobacteriota bacterium]|nr:CYTH domain-containing protein [Thermodesulfobacteriota bacterium]
MPWEHTKTKKMAIETEKKFLLKNDLWRQNAFKAVCLIQGYLKNDKTGVVRIRTAGTKGYITVKGITCKASRLEFEYEIPLKDAQDMLKRLCAPPLVKKKRHFIDDKKGVLWTVDEFSGENQGLILAEIELETIDQPFEKPEWLGREVTEDPRYFNSNLIKHPYDGKWDR